MPDGSGRVKRSTSLTFAKWTSVAACAPRIGRCPIGRVSSSRALNDEDGRHSPFPPLRAFNGRLPDRPFASAVRAEEEKVPQLKTFKDWMVGCNNIRACTAIGVSRTPGRLRAGAAFGRGEAQPQLILVVQGYDKLERPVMFAAHRRRCYSRLSKIGDWSASLDPSDTLATPPA